MKSRVVVAMVALAFFAAGPGTTVSEAQCTGNRGCDPTDFCEKATGDCGGEGVCSERPTMCPDVWAPVCGCDDTTYGNNCESAAAGINIAYEGECLPPPCQDNNDCLTGNYCQKTAGECTSAGTCSPQPSMCPLVLDPVCGCDSTTYGNACLAAQAGINVASEGECPPPPCQDNGDCSQGLFCSKTDGECADAGLCTESPTVCPDVWAPVCGCNGTTYGNDCEAALVGTNVAYDGECLTACNGHDDCSLGEYCDSAHNGCGAAGACRLRPDQCTQEYDPVCGCNELSFDNACLAAMQGVTVSKLGICGSCPFDSSTDCVFSDSLESGGISRWSRVVGN